MSSSPPPSPLRKAPRLLLCALLLGSAACAETGIELLSSVDGAEDDEGDDADGVDSGATGGAGGSDDAAATGGAAPSLCVDAEGAIPARAEIRNVLSGVCLGRGAASTVIQDPAFEIILQTCGADAGQQFELLAAGPGVYELRNQATAYDLDVRWASTDDGTTLVLHAPTGNFNQHFYFLPLGDTGQVQLAPRHALAEKCFALRSGQLELWPCDATAADQAFELLACP